MNNHHKSYKDNMKQRAMKKKQEQETFELELYAQLILDEAVFIFQEKRYQQSIDQALDRGDKKAFQEASKQYVAFLRSYKQELHFD
ncbi:IDEAL domain-containing protein [Pseudalkalibacillus sp. NRS-1564]|uniref:IDEAL domain-containing protein n=1 Tax=Pseudalkalibacillus sp. NRS-1564 TaxID=3233900 RepID=UPI003D2C73AE